MEVYFAGQTLDSRDPSEFEVDSRVVWPMPEGTALITFEEEEGECEQERVVGLWRPEC